MLSIDELAGNVATVDDRISVAIVKVSEPTCEPWLTLHYDEWMAVTKGRIVLNFGDGECLEVVAGKTVFIAKGERFQPVFPVGDTEYIPFCLPAFRPDRCIREEEPNSEVSTKLLRLHAGAKATAAANAEPEPAPEVLYHMCLKSLWDEAKDAETAYFPPTFEADGFTHATAVPGRLVETANHFYKDVEGDWVCLRFRRSALRRAGIMTKDEEAMPVGTKASNDNWKSWICPHVIGGIPPQVVDAEFPMLREGAEYTGIPGLTDLPRRVFKIATEEEVTKFVENGQVESQLDETDGYVHLSDNTAPPKVAKLFFTDCKDLHILEFDAEMFPGPRHWVVGKMGDAEPDVATKALATTVVHYLRADGCVHVYGPKVPMSALVRKAAVPLGEDGVHVFPDWL